MPDDYSTIQAAVDAAAPRDRVVVKDGTYQEQVVVDKDLTLTAASGASPTILAPNSPVQYTVQESGSTWEPVVFAFGGTESGGAVSGTGTNQIDIHGFTIDGNDRNPSDRSAGILLRNVRGHVAENTVENMHVGGNQTLGVVGYGDSDLRIEHNDVSEYERGGIGANGDGVNPAPTAHIRHNTVTGSTGIGEAWAPNGIQIGFGARGDIMDNEVSDNRWSSSDGVASGIIVFESDGVRVKGNSVTNSDAGITTGSWAWFLPTADGTQITQNEVEEANRGVLLQVVAWDNYSTTDPSVSNTKVTNNTIDDPDTGDGDVGIALDAIDADPDFDPILDNNKVVRNRVTGYDQQVDDEGTNTKVQALEP